MLWFQTSTMNVCSCELKKKCDCKLGEGCARAFAGNDLFFPHYLAAYVRLIYIHGYPDNEAFNPGDPAVRTMNPITSCRLRYGMADSETDGRDCGRPAIQSHLSHSPIHPPCTTPPPNLPLLVLTSQLINRPRPKAWERYVDPAPSPMANAYSRVEISGQSSLAWIRFTCSGFTCTSGTISDFLDFLLKCFF